MIFMSKVQVKKTRHSQAQGNLSFVLIVGYGIARVDSFD